jgi:hypothetical protein
MPQNIFLFILVAGDWQTNGEAKQSHLSWWGSTKDVARGTWY